MSVGAVYVVVVAGASLALFACLGLYAVRQGPGASLDWEGLAGEKKVVGNKFAAATISDCTSDSMIPPLIHCDIWCSHRSLNRFYRFIVCFLSSSDSEDLSC